MSTARRTALLSFLAALALVATKLLVGLATSSLGILAEALHSGLDAVAALLSLYAVGVAERPPDEQHQYGHGKAQHLAALSEAAILAAVAIWIGFEAVMRLRSGGGDVQPEWYAFVLLFGVLIVDAARWSVSFRTGTRERNAALLASAWHFASDFAGTTAVLIGLALVSAGYPRADAVAALTVAALVLVAAARLAVRNIDALMDRAPSGLDRRIGQIAQDVPGVAEVRSVRVREAGGESFADVVIGVSRLEGLERSHQTMDQVEDAVRSQIGPAQVTVHVEPSTGARGAQRAGGGGCAARAGCGRDAQHLRARARLRRPCHHAARAAARGHADARGCAHGRAAEAGDPLRVRGCPRVRARGAVRSGRAARA